MTASPLTSVCVIIALIGQGLSNIIFSLGYMNKTTYDIKTKTAKIQPGSDWGHVYEALNPYGVVAVGGRASIVGVGGFTTGGGVSQ